VLAYKSFPKPHWLQIHSTDEIDKRIHRLCDSFFLRRRPRGEMRRIGLKRRWVPMNALPI
jgi:hypothetical protein